MMMYQVLAICLLSLNSVIYSHKTPVIANDLTDIDFSHISEESTPALVFIFSEICDTCRQHQKLLEDVSVESLFAGELYVINASVTPFDIPLELPIVMIANSERILPYCGPVYHTHLLSAVFQFSVGVRAARLDDSNFEHDTQASTGFTTGNWLVIFDKMSTSNLLLYDGLALSLRARSINFGIVDPSQSPRTSKRFDVKPFTATDGPYSLIMLRRSELYRFSGELNRSDLSQMLEFALGGYTSHIKSIIPRPHMRFDQFVDWLVHLFKTAETEYGRALVLLLGSLLLLFSLTVISLILVIIFWAIRGFEFPSESQSEDTVSQSDVPPHEAGDDAGQFKSQQKPKTE